MLEDVTVAIDHKADNEPRGRIVLRESRVVLTYPSLLSAEGGSVDGGRPRAGIGGVPTFARPRRNGGDVRLRTIASAASGNHGSDDHRCNAHRSSRNVECPSNARSLAAAP